MDPKQWVAHECRSWPHGLEHCKMRAVACMAVLSRNKKFPSSPWSQALNAVKAHCALSPEGHVGSWALVRKLLNNQEASLCLLNGMRLKSGGWGPNVSNEDTLFLTTCFKMAWELMEEHFNQSYSNQCWWQLLRAS